MYAIEAENLRRTFRPPRGIFRHGPEFVAVDNVSLAVQPGTIYGLLGPNGAGKTTTIKMLSTLLVPTGGSARVAGFDVVQQEREVRQRLGVVLGGDRGLYNKLSARDNLVYFGHLYALPRTDIQRRVTEMLELVSLADRADDRVEGFSRGMKQRLHLAKALLHKPPVIFLDEPTIGLDPAAAVNLRRIVESLVPEQTVLLTTHYLHEADELCDRIAIIDQGRIIVEDTPGGIKRRVGGEQRYQVRVRGDVHGTLAATLRLHPAIRDVTIAHDATGSTTYTLRCQDEVEVIDQVVRIVQEQDAHIESIQTVDLTLEDAFLTLTNGANS